MESFVDIYPLFCGGLNEATAKVFGKFTTLFRRADSICGQMILLRAEAKKREPTMRSHLTFVLQIALVGYHNNRKVISVFDSKYLRVELRAVVQNVRFWAVLRAKAIPEIRLTFPRTSSDL